MGAIGRARVFASWNEAWDLTTYTMKYLRSRRIATTIDVRDRVQELLEAYRGPVPCTKADLDYYLDANLRR